MGLTADQKKNHSIGIGGSTASIPPKMNSYSTIYDLWLRMKGKVPDFEGNKSTYIGQLLETPMFQWYCDQFNVTLEIPKETKFMDGSDWVFANPDALYKNRKEGVDCKTAGFLSKYSKAKNKFGEEGTDQIPAEYIVQSQWYMAVYQYEVWHIPVWFSNGSDEIVDIVINLVNNSSMVILEKEKILSSFLESIIKDRRVYRVEYNHDFFSFVFDECHEFYKRFIVGDEVPEIQSSDTAKLYLDTEYPASKNNGSMVEAYDKESLWMDKYGILREERQNILDSAKGIEEQLLDLKFKLQHAIGNNSGMQSDSFIVTNKPDKNGRKRFYFKEKK